MKSSKNLKITIVGIGIALNVVGAFIAFNLRLPIYLDSIGTIMVSFLLGPLYGIITGVLGSFTSGITFDVYSFYFASVQVFTGFLAGFFFKKGFMKGKKIIFSTLIIGIVVSFFSAIITAYAFGGFTSSGSTYIVVILKNLGVNSVVSAFIVQFITDYLDKLITCIVMLNLVNKVPFSIKKRLNENYYARDKKV